MNANLAARFRSIFVFTIISTFVIIAKIQTNESGYLTPDSTSYLRLAQRLVEGKGFTVPNSGRQDASDIHFAVWPVGYPLLICAAASALGVSVFTASKIANLTMLFLTGVIIRLCFLWNGGYLTALLLSGAYLEIFSFTWSEAPFIFLLLCVGVLLPLATKGSGSRVFFSIFSLFVCSSFLFLTRYVGAMSVLSLAYVALVHFYRRNFRMASFALACAITMLVFVGLYLQFNKLQTGFYTGMDRISPPETFFELAGQTLIAIVRGAIIPLAQWDFYSWKQDILVVAWLCTTGLTMRSLRMQIPRSVDKLTIDSLSVSCFIVGSIYIFIIVVLRWYAHFDPLGYRLLAPGTLLILLATGNFVFNNAGEARRRFVYYLYITAAISVFASLYPFAANFGNYRNVEAALLRRYAQVPDGSIVIFAPISVTYLRSDLHLSEPSCLPYSSKDEDWDVFLRSLDVRRNIFVDVPETGRDNSCDVSVRNFIKSHRYDGLMRLDRLVKD